MGDSIPREEKKKVKNLNCFGKGVKALYIFLLHTVLNRQILDSQVVEGIFEIVKDDEDKVSSKDLETSFILFEDINKSVLVVFFKVKMVKGKNAKIHFGQEKGFVLTRVVHCETKDYG